MDGAKSTTDTEDVFTKVNTVIGRRAGWVEACMRVCVDRSVMKILVVVGA